MSHVSHHVRRVSLNPTKIHPCLRICPQPIVEWERKQQPYTRQNSHLPRHFSPQNSLNKQSFRTKIFALGREGHRIRLFQSPSIPLRFAHPKAKWDQRVQGRRKSFSLVPFLLNNPIFKKKKCIL